MTSAIIPVAVPQVHATGNPVADVVIIACSLVTVGFAVAAALGR